MGTEENKAILRRLYEDVINTGNLGLADEFIAVDQIEHEDFPGMSAEGLAGFKEFFTMFRSAFPDLHFTVDARGVYGTMVDKWLGLDAVSVTGGNFEQLDFV